MPFWAPFLETFWGKKRDEKWGKNHVRLGWRFGGILADLGLHFGLDFGTFSALEGEK